MACSAEQYLQARSEDVTGQPVSAIGVDDLVTALEAAKNAADPVAHEIAAPEDRTLYASVSPVRGVGWVMVMQDITALKELDGLRTERVAAVSHDLKNPIAAIQMSVGLIEKAGPLTDMQRELLESTVRSSQRLRALVTDVLDLARLEAGPTLRTNAVSLADIVAEALGELKQPAEKKHQTVVTELPQIYHRSAGTPHC